MYTWSVFIIPVQVGKSACLTFACLISSFPNLKLHNSFAALYAMSSALAHAGVRMPASRISWSSR